MEDKLRISRTCALCYNTFWERHLKKITKNTREILSVLLIQLDSNKNGLVMCKSCSNKVKALFDFKSACLYTEDFITPFVGEETKNRVGLKELFLKEKGYDGELADILCNKSLCRLCTSVADVGCLDLEGRDPHVNFVKDRIKKCIPEVNVGNTRDVIVCDACVESLKDYSDFLDLCLCIEKDNDFQIKTEESQNETLDPSLEICEEDFNGNDQLKHLKRECQPTGNNPEAKLDNQHPSVFKFDVFDEKPNILPVINTSVEQFENGLKRYGKLRQRNNFKTRANQLEKRRKCNLCDYKTKDKNSLKIHKLVHKDPADIKWFICDLCDYRSKNIHYMKGHMLVHKDPSETKWFKCDLCPFKSKWKGNLNHHITLVHKDPAEVKWFECVSCDYKTKTKSSLKVHMVVHKNPAEMEWLSCHLCDHKTNQKWNLKKHMLIHQDPLDIKWFECRLCDYKSNQNNNLKRHMLAHTDESQIKWFKCPSCDFKTKQKSTLQSHMSVHKNPSEIEWFKCNSCSSKFKCKSHLKRHMVLHKDPSEIKWYECHSCEFKSKHKESLKPHMLIHTDPTKIKWLECDVCGYKSKDKSNYKRHLRRHRASGR